MFNILWCHCLVAQLCPTLYDPMNFSPPGSSIFPGKNDEWVDISSPGDHPTQGSNLRLLISGGFFTTEPPGKPCYPHRKVKLLSCV